MPGSDNGANRNGGFDQAVKRVMDALDALDAVLEQRLGKDGDSKGGAGGSLVEQLHAFNIDRARLALELDSVRARARDLEKSNREAVRRIEEAMSAIRAVLAANRN
jgi:cephalosporin-C deacetylase-like acetyl esterase